MSQSLAKIILHIVFSTKNRLNLIPKNILQEVHAYIASICRNKNSEAFRVGGTQNHIHIACTLPRTLTVSQLLEEIKTSSSKWIKNKDHLSSDFSWQAGYGVFSLGYSQLETLIRYIDKQEEHHQQNNFQDELTELLDRYDLKYDTKYLWD